MDREDPPGRKTAGIQLFQSLAGPGFLLSYDLKMLSYSSKGEPSVDRMNAAQRAKFDAYYGPIEADLKSKNLTGKALAEWKYQRYMKDYYSTAESLDRNIGRMLDYLEKHKLDQNTIVIYMSDQGFYLGEHGWFDKRFMYEESFRTPMLMSYPGVIKPGTKNSQLVMNLDVAPSLLDAAGLAIPSDMQGKSMLPVLTDKAAKGRDALYYHYYENGEHAVSPHFGVSTKDYKLIRFYKRVDSWELFDLNKDPSEESNVYGKKGYEKTMLALKQKLAKLIKQYEDKEAEMILRSEL